MIMGVMGGRKNEKVSSLSIRGPWEVHGLFLELRMVP